MTIVEKIEIVSSSALIYLKHILSKLPIEDTTYYLLAASELGTNILKYAKTGWIYILQENRHYMLAACDYGSGIQDLTWVREKGTTTAKNSLGLGLYQLSNSENFNFSIFSSTQKEMHGTVAILYPKKFNPKICFLSEPYINESNNGDFIAKKGKFLLFGDASGHNYKSHMTAVLIKEKFNNTILSCILIEDFFKQIHSIIKKEHRRGAVFCIAEVVNENIQICGIGNIDIWEIAEKAIRYHSLKSGIVGESISGIRRLKLTLEDKVLLTSDGIERKKMQQLLPNLHGYDALTYTIATIHFCKNRFDDRSVLTITKGVPNGKQF